jgi:hypothetical protein
MPISFLPYYSDLKMEATFSALMSLDFQIHGIISQNTELFITTAVKASNSALKDKFYI